LTLFVNGLNLKIPSTVHGRR